MNFIVRQRPFCFLQKRISDLCQLKLWQAGLQLLPIEKEELLKLLWILKLESFLVNKLLKV